MIAPGPLWKFSQSLVVAGVLAISLSLCVLIEKSAAQSQKQQLIAAAKQSCKQSKAQLEQTQLPNLRRKQALYKILLKDWKEKMPAKYKENLLVQLQEGFSLDLDALKVLFDSYGDLALLLKFCEGITDETSREMIAQSGSLAKTIDDVLKQRQARWDNHEHSKVVFKDSLKISTDLLMQYNPSQASTYIDMKVQLDPDSINQTIAYQRTLLLPAVMAFGLLK